MTILQLILESPKTLRLAPLTAPGAPGPGEALVRTLRVGICGTDLHAFAGSQPMIRYPVVPGHELAVEVLEVGPDDGSQAAARVTPGDVCTVVPYLSDGTCPACRRGLPNCCEQLRVLGVHTDGGMRSRSLVPRSALLPAPGLDTDAVALTEMLAVGHHAVVRSGVTASDTVAVVGAGPIGLGCLSFASMISRRIVAVDPDTARLELARRVAGAAGLAPGPDLADRLRGYFDTELPTVVIDATGNAAAMQASPLLAAHGGRVTYVGHTGGGLTLSNPVLHQRELTIRASRNATRADFAAVLGALEAGRVSADGWISHRVTPEQLPAALDSWTTGRERPIKAILEMA